MTQNLIIAPMQLKGVYITDKILIPSIPEDSLRYITMQVILDPVRKGDVIQIISELQATNNTNQWAMYGGYVIASTGIVATTGKQITNRGVENFNPQTYWVGRSDVHHLDMKKNGVWIADNNYPLLYVSHVVWSGTDPAQKSYKLDIDQDLNSKLQVLVFGN